MKRSDTPGPVNLIAREHVESPLAYAAACWGKLATEDRGMYRRLGSVRVLFLAQRDTNERGVFEFTIGELEGYRVQ